MITLFILKSGEKQASFLKLINSFEPKTTKASHYVNTCQQINEMKCDTDWFGVFYDNEILSKGLRKAIPLFIDFYKGCDSFILFKLIKDDGVNIRAFRSPRLFKKGIVIPEDSLLPEDRSIKYEAILDGFLLEQKHDNKCLIDAFNNIRPAASQAGLSVEETVAVLSEIKNDIDTN